MTNFEIDMPTSKAARFDRAIYEFVKLELRARPDVDIRMTMQTVDAELERRAVFVSSASHMKTLLHRLQRAVA